MSAHFLPVESLEPSTSVLYARGTHFLVPGLRSNPSPFGRGTSLTSPQISTICTLFLTLTIQPGPHRYPSISPTLFVSCSFPTCCSQPWCHSDTTLRLAYPPMRTNARIRTSEQWACQSSRSSLQPTRPLYPIAELEIFHTQIYM